MRQEMFNVFGRVASSVKPAVLIHLYRVLQVNVCMIAYTVVRFCTTHNISAYFSAVAVRFELVGPC